jgi:hypothetical protein
LSLTKSYLKLPKMWLNGAVCMGIVISFTSQIPLESTF